MKMEKVFWQGTFEEAEERDLLYWMNKTVKERLEEALDWNRRVWAQLHGHYPEQIELYGGKMIKKETDEDDF